MDEISEWKIFIEELISEIRMSPKGSDRERLAFIFVEEEMWDRLVALIRERRSIYTIREFEPQLLKHCPIELADLYGEGILQFMRFSVGRNYYQGACNYIKRLDKLGFPQKAMEIIGILRETYPFRTALIEELNKIRIALY